MNRFRQVTMFTLGLLLCAAPAGAKQKQPVVAVFDLEAQRVRLDRKSRAALGDYLAVKLASIGGYKVLPRRRVKRQLVGKKRASYRDCYARSCQIAIGGELAANKALSAKLRRLGKRCSLTLALYDLRTATLERGSAKVGGCSERAIMATIDLALGALAAGAKPLRPPRPGRGPLGLRQAQSGVVYKVDGVLSVVLPPGSSPPRKKVSRLASGYKSIDYSVMTRDRDAIVFGYADLPRTAAPPEQILDRTQRRMLGRTGRELVSLREGWVGRYPARTIEYSYARRGGKARTRLMVVVKRGRLFKLVYVSFTKPTLDRPEIDQFFSSLTLGRR